MMKEIKSEKDLVVVTIGYFEGMNRMCLCLYN